MTFIKFVILFAYITSEGLAVRLEQPGSNINYKESQNVEEENRIGSVHSRLRSVFQNTKINQKRRRKLKQDETRYRMLSRPTFIEDTNFYLPDSSENRWKNLQRVNTKNGQKMPKIYITKLPVEKVVKEPEIFFSNQFKENETAVQLIKIDNNAKETMGVLKDNALHTDDKDNVVINEGILEPAIRSDHFYQDGLENVNDMIYNSQVINQPSNSVNSFNGKKKNPEYSTEYPYLENVSSTAMIVSDPGDGLADDDKYAVEGEGGFEEDLAKLGSADKIQPSLPANDHIFGPLKDEEWVMPVLVMASLTILLLVVSEAYIIFCSLKHRHRYRKMILSQILMAGLLCCAIMSMAYTIQPSPVICGVIRLGSGLSYTLLYSTLVVKIIFLISRNSGINLHTAYQIILLFSAVLIQLVVLIHWLVANPPAVSSASGSHSSCTTSFTQQLHGHAYNIFLIAVLSLLSLLFHRARPACREGLSIIISTVLSAIIWTAWVIAGYLVPTQYKDLCSSAGLIASALATWCAMFLPRGGQADEDGKEDRTVLSIREEAASPSVLSRDLSNISLVLDNDQVQCCSRIRNLFYKRSVDENELQNAVVKLLISKTFGSQRNTNFPKSSSSGVDGDIYFLSEDGPEVGLTIQSRSQTLDNLARSVLNNTSGLSDYDQVKYSMSNTFDRFPFSSRPPQFDPSPTPSQVPSQTPVPTSPPLPRVYSQASKVIAKSKPSLSNPNVIFCKPDEMTRTIIY